MQAGVVKVIGNTKLAHDQGRVFEALGWREAERIFVKVLAGSYGHWIVIGAGISAAGSLFGSSDISDAADKAAQAQVQAAQTAAATQKDFFGQAKNACSRTWISAAAPRGSSAVAWPT